MTNRGPILFIEDDPDDQQLVRQALLDLGIENRFEAVSTGEEALTYLQTKEAPFIILCGYRLPGMDGVELRKRIEDDQVMREKSIPFIFFSTTVSNSMKKEVYKMNVQGLFEKGDSYDRIKHLLRLIYDYWQECRHPKN